MRFIAGAVCPRCGAMDTLRAEASPEAEEQTRECVDCGFSETVAAGPNQASAQPDTRINATPRDDGRQVIKIMPDVSRRKH